MMKSFELGLSALIIFLLAWFAMVQAFGEAPV